MAKMPDTIRVKIISDKVTMCYAAESSHRFELIGPPQVEGFFLALCIQCGMALDLRFEDASRS